MTHPHSCPKDSKTQEEREVPNISSLVTVDQVRHPGLHEHKLRHADIHGLSPLMCQQCAHMRSLQRGSLNMGRDSNVRAIDDPFVTTHIHGKQMICKVMKTFVALRSSNELIPQPAVCVPMLPSVPPLHPLRRHPMWLVPFALTTDYHYSMEKDRPRFPEGIPSTLVHRSNQGTYYRGQQCSCGLISDSSFHMVHLTLRPPDRKRTIGPPGRAKSTHTPRRTPEGETDKQHENLDKKGQALHPVNCG